MASPLFIVSSGRSGTAMLVKALSNCKEIIIEHEYMIGEIQTLSVLKYNNLIDDKDAIHILKNVYLNLIKECPAKLWGDSSNKLSWLIKELIYIFPNAKFIFLVRDGRKVVSSYYNKLKNECYDDYSNNIMGNFIRNPLKAIQPPKEKKYWWPHPVVGSVKEKEFRDYDQFSRICWYWSEVNNVIIRDLNYVPASQYMFVKLEELSSNKSIAKNILDFLDVEWFSDFHSIFNRPHNVNIPIDFDLSDVQIEKFYNICSEMMEILGYQKDKYYKVVY